MLGVIDRRFLIKRPISLVREFPVINILTIGQNLGNAIGPMLGGVLVVPLGYKGLFSGFSIALLIGGALRTVLQ